jgi:hypothetical protein
MIRRTLVIAVFAIVLVSCAAPSALAFTPLWSEPVDAGASLATGDRGPIVAWEVAGAGTAAIEAAQYPREGGAALSRRTIVPAVAGLEDWHVAGDGASHVTVVWRVAGVVSVKRVDLQTGVTEYGPVTVCSDAQAVTLRGAGATVVPAGVAADGAGGAYVWCTLSPSSLVTGVGDTLLNHVSSAGDLAVPDPGVAVAKGTVKALAVDSAAHAVVLLDRPGRTGLAVQRYDTAVAADWGSPVTPYNPLLGPPPAATQVPIGVVASSQATIAWREGTKVRVQRFSLAGSRLWLTPARVAMGGAVRLAEDGAGGSYLAGPSGSGIVVRHLLPAGAEAAGSPSARPGLGMSQPRVDAVSANRAGDLTVVYSDAALPATGAPGVSTVDCLGAWSTATIVAVPEPFTATAHDGAGGAYVVGAGELLRFARADALTLRPRSRLVQYGKSVTVAGYATGPGGLPVGGASVEVRRVTGSGTAAGATDTTDAQGFYQTSLQPRSNATWRAVTGGTAGEEALIRVMPRVTLAVSHLKAGTVLTEIFTGSVAPNHPGRRVLIKKAVGSGWRTVASGLLDGRSRYRVTWRLPYRTATYKLRAVLPKDADHAEGSSITATVKVVIRKG